LEVSNIKIWIYKYIQTTEPVNLVDEGGGNLNAQTRLFAMLLILVTPIGGATKHDPIPAASACDVLEQALSASKHVTVGKQRKDVERYFERDGGLQFPGATRYSYVECHLLHLDVEFDRTKNAQGAFSPDDTITNVSKLYVEYPAKD
jgi:hypothetical protein